MIDSLKYAKTLEEAGVPRHQAEVHVRLMTEMTETHFATKQDLKDLDLSVQHQIERLVHQMDRLEDRLTLKLGAVMSVLAGLIIAAIKLL